MILLLALALLVASALLFGPAGPATLLGLLLLVLFVRRARRRAGHRQITYTLEPPPGRPGHRGRKAVL